MHPYRTAMLTRKDWAGSMMMKLTFQCDSPFSFHPGQFVSVYLPGQVKRLYSLASSYELAKVVGYELCIKKVPGGAGSEFFSKLQPGEHFSIQAPYGHFGFHSGRGRPVIFIATGSGIAPLRSIAMSKAFQSEEIPFSMGLFGFRNSIEIPYPGEFEALGIATRYAISKENAQRVTDVLRNLKSSFPWRECDFYMCGNPEMIREVREILQGHGVSPDAVFFESFEAVPTTVTGSGAVLENGRNRAA